MDTGRVGGFCARKINIFPSNELSADEYLCLSFLGTVARARQYFLAGSTL